MNFIALRGSSSDIEPFLYALMDLRADLTFVDFFKKWMTQMYFFFELCAFNINSYSCYSLWVRIFVSNKNDDTLEPSS